MNNRGVQDVYVFCVDGLNGFREPIGAVYPKQLMADLKPVYQAVNEEEGMAALARFSEKWCSITTPV